MAFRFEWRMGVATVIGLIHDVFFMLAVFSILRLEVDITFIAAVLTIVGYSINDTIVTFDRIRENLNRRGTINDVAELADIVNKSLRQTLGRSVNTVLDCHLCRCGIDATGRRVNPTVLHRTSNRFDSRDLFFHLHFSSNLV